MATNHRCERSICQISLHQRLEKINANRTRYKQAFARKSESGKSAGSILDKFIRETTKAIKAEMKLEKGRVQ